MTAPQSIAGLSGLSPRYDVLLCDVWGVIHNGRESFPAACAALARFRAERGPVVMISNAPRPCGPVAAQLDGLGVPRDAWSHIVTSGDATRVLLAERAPGPAWLIGSDRHEPLYEGLGITPSSLAEARFISVTKRTTNPPTTATASSTPSAAISKWSVRIRTLSFSRGIG